MSGVQAIVRVTLDQRRLDRRRGLDTGAFVSGYEGSPLGGLDLELARASAHLATEGVVFRPGLERGAGRDGGGRYTAPRRGPRSPARRRHRLVVREEPGPRPGGGRHPPRQLRRHRAPGGVVALIGDDPACKSSTLPSSSWTMAKSLCLPLLAPGTVADVVRLGPPRRGPVPRHRALGRAADRERGGRRIGRRRLRPWRSPLPASRRRDRRRPGCWSDPPRSRPRPICSRCGSPPCSTTPGPPVSTTVVADSPKPRLAVVASGTAFAAVRRAVEDLGLSGRTGAELGLRLIRVDLPWPLDGDELARLTVGLDEVLVVEDKAAFIESQLKEALYGRIDAARVTGKSDPDGRELIPATGTVDLRRSGPGPRPSPRARPAPSPGRPPHGRALGGSPPAAPPRAAAVENPVFLLWLPPQRLDPGVRRPARRARHRLSHHGCLRRARPGPPCGPHPDGRRGRPVDRVGALLRWPPLRAEPGRRHLLPLRLARSSGSGGGGRRHHLPPPLQRRRGHDRGPGAGRAAWRCPSSPGCSPSRGCARWW